MRALLIAVCLAALPLAACADGDVSSAGTVAADVADATVSTKPIDVANKTTLDERLATAAQLSYTTASRLGTALASGGLIDQGRFKALDNEAYDAILAVRAAYAASNAASYKIALDRVDAAVAGINALVNPK